MFALTALRLRASIRKTWLCWLVLFIPSSPLQAHVGLDSPNGDEALTVGSEFTIQWHVAIQHNTLDWDLWYSIDSNDGPWQEIALDLPAGNISEGAVHSFDWTVPDVVSSDAWVRVRQDNAGDDYFDVSDASFSIIADAGGGDFTGDGFVDGADLTAWQQGFGTQSAAASDGDADLDGDADGTDFLAWQIDASTANAAALTHAVPEPAATVLLLVGLLLMLLRSH